MRSQEISERNFVGKSTGPYAAELPQQGRAPGLSMYTGRGENNIRQKHLPWREHEQFRPPSSFTIALKRQQLVAYGYADTNPADYEEDHLISLEIGGSGADPKNLWPEPHAGKDNSFDKDKVENWLHRQICSGAMTPGEAQRGISTDWRQFLSQVNGVATRKKEIQ